MAAFCNAAAQAIVRSLTIGSMRSSNSTTIAESPAATIRYGVTPAPAAASDECRRIRRSTSTRRDRPRRCSRTMVATMSSTDTASRADGRRRLRGRARARTSTAVPPPAGRSEDRGEDDFVGAGKGPGEIVLKHAAARRSRARLEHRPDSRVGIRRAQPDKRLGDRGRMVGEVVVDRHAVRDADDLETPLDAGEGRAGPRRCDRHQSRPPWRRRSRPARFARCRRRPAARRTRRTARRRDAR